MRRFWLLGWLILSHCSTDFVFIESTESLLTDQESNETLSTDAGSKVVAATKISEDAGVTPQTIRNHSCIRNQDCGQALPLCHPKLGCVECTSNSNCAGGGPCVVSIGRCAIGCVKGEEEEEQCPPLYFPYGCRDDFGAPRCTQCRKDRDCAGSRVPYCQVERAVCVECLTDAQCASGHCNIPRGRCE